MSQLFHIKAAPQPILLDRYRDILRQDGAKATRSTATLLNKLDRDELYYVPFEHMNPSARLVIVGITPGPKQIALSYESVQGSLMAGLSDELVLERAKRAGSFGGATMRPNLIKMLEFFCIPRRLKISAASELWTASSALLHATSVVPHAAFRNGKPFTGSFQDVFESEPFRVSFERDFAATLPLLLGEARYIALGPTPLAALDWCAEQGLITKDQVLGAFAHPSSSGGSEVPVYLGERKLAELKPRDPVANRGWLIHDAARMSRAVEAWMAQ